MALVSMLPLPFRFKLKAEREQYPDEPFTPKPFLEGAQDAYRHYLAQSRTQRENNWTRGSVTAIKESLYQLEGALPVRINEPADDEADFNSSSKSLDELETVNDMRTMREDDSEDMVDPPLRDTTPAFITPPPREHIRRSLAEQRRQRAAAPTADNDQVDPDESHDPEDPSSDRAQQNEFGDYDEPSVPRPQPTQHGAPQLAHTQLPAAPSVPSMLSSSIPTASSLPDYSVNSDGIMALSLFLVSKSAQTLHPTLTCILSAASCPPPKMPTLSSARSLEFRLPIPSSVPSERRVLRPLPRLRLLTSSSILASNSS
jgi:hypothetical protein